MSTPSNDSDDKHGPHATSSDNKLPSSPLERPDTSINVLDCSSLDHIPETLRVRVLYYDTSIVVIAKPGHLRSVPGHARNNGFVPFLPTGPRKRPRDDDDKNRVSGQKAWIAAIQSLKDDDASSGESSEIDECIARLADNPALVASAPRKVKVFCRYIHRNKQRLTDTVDGFSEEVAEAVFARIQERYRAFLPESTKPEDSALGQLSLLGLGKTDRPNTEDLYIVHRLDCETSGVMVFARTQSAAAGLANDWRKRDSVHKTYVAHVRHWPPYLDDGLRSGTIDLPLKPSEERIKWQVCSEDDVGARPCKTLWRVLDDSARQESLLLELSPVTGRTHQLRIHCAAIGSGISGDTLYSGKTDGKDINGAAIEASHAALCLHAHKLSFSHPESGRTVEFVAETPRWFCDVSAK